MENLLLGAKYIISNRKMEAVVLISNDSNYNKKTGLSVGQFITGT